MIQERSLLRVTDNSGVRIAKCISILGKTKQKIKSVHNIILISVKKINRRLKKNVKKGEVYRALYIRSKIKNVRYDGSSVRFNENSVIILKKNKLEILGTRVKGPIFLELKKSSYKTFKKKFTTKFLKTVVSLSSKLI